MTKSTHFTPESTHILTKLHELLEKGGIIDGVWLHRAIEDLVFNRETELSVSLDQAKSHIKYLQEQYEKFEKLYHEEQLKGKNK